MTDKNVTAKVDWPGVGSEAVELLREFARDALDGAQSDVDAFWHEGASLLHSALMMNDDAMTDRVKNALMVVAERNRIRIVNEKWEMLEKGIDLARRVAAVALRNVVALV